MGIYGKQRPEITGLAMPVALGSAADFVFLVRHVLGLAGVFFAGLGLLVGTRTVGAQWHSDALVWRWPYRVAGDE